MTIKQPQTAADLKSQPQRAAYGLGYRNGMEDIAVKIRDEGLAGAIQWIRDNGGDEAREALADVETTADSRPDPVKDSRSRVREYLRQRSLVNDVCDEIHGVHYDPQGEMASLFASDLTAVLATADAASAVR